VFDRSLLSRAEVMNDKISTSTVLLPKTSWLVLG